MLRLLKYLGKKEWLLVLLALGCIVLQVGLELALPDYMHEITGLVEAPEPDMGEILATGRKMLLAALGSLAAALGSALLASRAAASFAARLRECIFDKILALDSDRIAHFGVPGLVNRTANDVLQLQLATVLALEVLVRAPILVVWAVVKIGLQGQGGGLLITALGVLAMALLLLVCVGITVPKYRKMQQLTDDLGRITHENLKGLHTVRALEGERFEEERFERANEELTKTHLFTAHSMSTLVPGVQLINNLLTVGVYFLGAVALNALAPEARLGVFSDTVAFLSYLLRITTAFLLVAAASVFLPRAGVCARRIAEVLSLRVPAQKGTVRHTDRHGEVELQGVSYYYAEAEEYVLHDVSFAAHTGEVLGIVAPSGSGKSTVLSLLPRLLQATEGRVLLNGVSVEEYDLEELRRRIGVVTQEPFLFTGTVRENVTFGRTGDTPLSEGRYREIMQAVQASELADQHITVGEGGKNLSAGEAQRVAIARALCSEPEVLLLDDAFTFFDYATAAAIRQGIRALFPHMTCIVAAQRVVNVRHADRIVVMSGGRVEAIGTHEQLMQTCALYRDTVQAQRGEVDEKC